MTYEDNSVVERVVDIVEDSFVVERVVDIVEDNSVVERMVDIVQDNSVVAVDKAIKRYIFHNKKVSKV
jgi:hypothetical protein